MPLSTFHGLWFMAFAHLHRKREPFWHTTCCVSSETSRGGSLRFRKWNYFSQKVHSFPDRGRQVAITQLKQQHGKVHFTIKCHVVARVFINHTHKVGKKMFPFKLLEVYYIKKKSGKRSENIMIQKLNNTALGTRSRDSAVRALLRHH